MAGKEDNCLRVAFTDGCVFVLHGEDWSPKWCCAINGKLLITCPHGLNAAMSTNRPPVEEKPSEDN